MAYLWSPLLSEREHLMAGLLNGDYLRLKASDEDLVNPLIPRKMRRQIISSPYIRHKGYKDRSSLIPHNIKHFQVNVDVQQFSPEEITVKSIDDTVVVECKHEEKEDDHGYISRHFVRKYKIPKDHDIAKCISKLSSDGVLTIIVPKVEKNEKVEVEIPITFTNKPSRIQNSTQQVAETGEDKEKEQKRTK